MKEGFIGEASRKLHYLEWGSGPRLIVAFHGYSNNAGIYNVLAHYIPKDYRLVSIDLPFHGKSEWKGQAPITRKELTAMVNSLRQGDKKKIALSGFSLGGRVALTLIEQMPKEIDSAYLMAPDGLIPNPVYWFVTRNAVGRKLFQGMIKDPSKHLQLVQWLRRKGWVDASRQQFVEYFLGSQYSRDFLGNAWPAVQELVPSITRVRNQIEAHKMPVHLFMGKWDSVIPPKNAVGFARNSKYINVHVLDKGHRVLDDDTARRIGKMLSDRS